ncbi:hypothetical protein [Vibrio vulnificus]|uniref:hypothetical protein n=1 Tax=Vibrio vulnificus TaxID=672 RepID=UPI001A29AF4C|nr:hypothetical protein [Vibrio vulnificus]MCA0766279.1 hypothetical protein [Vibrio vulnificus]HAT8542861.1 hypothetical protein [Vibrio vulnificus]
MNNTDKRLFDFVLKAATNTYIQAINDHTGASLIPQINLILRTNEQRIEALLASRLSAPFDEALRKILKVTQKAQNTKDRQLLIGHLEYIKERLDSLNADLVNE